MYGLFSKSVCLSKFVKKCGDIRNFHMLNPLLNYKFPYKIPAEVVCVMPNIPHSCSKTFFMAGSVTPISKRFHNLRLFLGIIRALVFFPSLYYLIYLIEVLLFFAKTKNIVYFVPYWNFQ